MRILSSVIIGIGLLVAAAAEVPGSNAVVLLAALGLFQLFLIWRTGCPISWAGLAAYAFLGATWFLPFLPGVGTAYPPTRFLVVVAGALWIASGNWDTSAIRPSRLALWASCWLGLLLWRAYNLCDALAYGYDLAHVQNLLVNTLHGRFLFSDYTQGSILSHHLFVSLALLAPLYARFPHPFTLQAAQILMMGASAALIAAGAKRRFGPAVTAPVFLGLLMHPAFVGQALHEFDPGVIGLFGTAIALWGFGRDKVWALWGGIFLALLSKEHFAAAAVIAGFLMTLRAETRRTGLILAGLGILVGASFAAYAWTSSAPFNLKTQMTIRYGAAGSAAPLSLSSTIGYILHLLLPSGGVALTGIAELLPALPELLVNITSRFPMHSLSTHYHVLTLPFLGWATAAGIARLEKWRGPTGRTAARYALAASVLAATFSQIGPISHSLAFYDILAKPRPAYAVWRDFVAKWPIGNVAVKGGYRLLLLVPDRRPIMPLPYVNLDTPIRERAILVLDDTPDSSPTGYELIARRDKVRVFRRK